jgi:hypothetical protein
VEKDGEAGEETEEQKKKREKKEVAKNKRPIKDLVNILH